MGNETFFGDLQYASNYFQRSLPLEGNILGGAYVLQAERKDHLQGLSGNLERLHLSDDTVSHGTLKVLNLALLK